MEENEEMEHLYALMKDRDVIAQNTKLRIELEKQLDEKDVMGEFVLKQGTDERRMVEQALEDRNNLDKAYREKISVEYNLNIQEVSHGLTKRIKSVQERYPNYQEFTDNSGDFPEDPREQARRMYDDTARELREHEQTVSQFMQQRWEAQQTSHQRPNSPGRARFASGFASDSSGDNVAEIYKKERESVQQEKAREMAQEKERGRTL